MRRIVLIVGHGSRDASANQEFEQLVARYQARRPELHVCYGYLELAQPLLADALAELPLEVDEVVLLPLFLFAAGHIKTDIPAALAAVRGLRPQTRFGAARELGVHKLLIDLALARAGEVYPLTDAQVSKTVLIVVGRGSSDADANAEFRELARLIGQRRPFAQTLPSFIAMAEPPFEETLELAARAEPETILIIPYLLFAGRLLAQLQDQVAAFRSLDPSIETTLASQLGVDDRLLSVMDERLNEVLSNLAAE